MNCLQEWGEFLHIPGQKFFEFSDIEVRTLVRSASMDQAARLDISNE